MLSRHKSLPLPSLLKGAHYILSLSFLGKMMLERELVKPPVDSETSSPWSLSMHWRRRLGPGWWTVGGNDSALSISFKVHPSQKTLDTVRGVRQEMCSNHPQNNVNDIRANIYGAFPL